MPVVARKTDTTLCPAHGVGRITEGFAEVLVCFKPVARKGDPVLCQDASADTIVEVSSSVWIGGELVALKGDRTAHGAVITTGCPRVFVGMGLRNICKLRAAHQRALFLRYHVKKQTAPFLAPTAD